MVELCRDPEIRAEIKSKTRVEDRVNRACSRGIFGITATHLVFSALCVEHGEEHFAVAVATLFICRKDLSQTGWGRL